MKEHQPKKILTEIRSFYQLSKEKLIHSKPQKKNKDFQSEEGNE